MRDWLTYTGAFVCGLIVAYAAYITAFQFVMSRDLALSMTGFVGLVILLPMLLGAFVFGVIYPRFSGVQFTGGDWLNGFAFTFAITIMCTGLILSRAMAQLPATLLLVALLFIGARVLIARKRASNE
ncbi:hypothetical protein SAMN05444714_0578 [Yoonia litorea]|uniref:Uncharacterized protein n=1 Tax=Yoonia litorea TaxID=1123755 RepID=A0A1I6LIQ3_9RHOB|nr:hypothetical protein SAMN05444714_0578 [Yoonia litorea]